MTDDFRSRFRSDVMSGLGDGTHKLSVTAAIRKVIDKDAGDAVTVHLTERLWSRRVFFGDQAR